MSSHFFQGFTKSLGVIFASEIGDKTFFIAAIMAMRNPRMLVRPQHRTMAARNREHGHTP
jgi:putative Ca2+/H+ antiporter (TMEM165/GDT1 family)